MQNRERIAPIPHSVEELTALHLVEGLGQIALDYIVKPVRRGYDAIGRTLHDFELLTGNLPIQVPEQKDNDRIEQ